MQGYPLSVQTTYQDLLEMLKLRAISDIGGAPMLKTMGTSGYWYARKRVGHRVVDRYLGRDTPELRVRLDQSQKIRAEQATLDEKCSICVAQLRAAGVPSLDRETGKVLRALEQSGTFRLGGTLVGTHAFRLYAAELGVPLQSVFAVTQDVDIAAFENLKLVINDQADPALVDTFRDLGLKPAPGLDPKHRPTRWVTSGGGAIVDFLVPRMQDETDIVFLPPLGVYAQALSFLNYLLAEPIYAAGLYRSGILVQVPRPQRYAIHKLIVAQRRTADTAAKARKDLAQAEILVRVLAEDRPYDLKLAYEEALAMGPKWRTEIERSLKQRSEIAEILRQL